MSEKMKYRKRPVEIEAWQNVGGAPMPAWVLDEVSRTDNGALIIPTLEGNMRAGVGDWIIRGVKGEVYPCKPDIFEMTYEPAREAYQALTTEAPQVTGEMPSISDLREEGVNEITAPYRKQITSTPELLSLLYDVDLLPEQITKRVNAIRMAGFCEVYKKYNLPPPPEPSQVPVEVIERAKEVIETWLKQSRFADVDFPGLGARLIVEALASAGLLPSQPSWQDVSTAPKCEDVLVGCWLSNRRWFQIVAQKIPARADAWVSDSGEMTIVPTHWMPIPSGPGDTK